MKLTSSTTPSDVQRKWWAQQAVVYFLAAGKNPAAIKIGVTQWSRVNSRLAACQTGNHEQLELIGIIPFKDGDLPLKNAEDAERTLHLRFRELRRFPEGTRGQEWFTASPVLLEYIRDNTMPPEKFGFVRRISTLIDQA
jgi:hypothetical protein